MSLAGFFILADTLTPVLGSEHLLEQTEDILEDFAREVQEYAQANAPWADQTGAARAGLTADVYREDKAVILQLYHTVDYGLYLETIQAGRFAIIMPTLEAFSAEIMRRCGAEETGVNFE